VLIAQIWLVFAFPEVSLGVIRQLSFGIDYFATLPKVAAKAKKH
jgi:hypothetical protein